MDKNTLRSELKKLFFAFIVEEFNDIKKLYKSNPLKAFELFEQKLEEIDKKTKTKSKVHSLNIERI